MRSIHLVLASPILFVSSALSAQSTPKPSVAPPPAAPASRAPRAAPERRAPIAPRDDEAFAFEMIQPRVAIAPKAMAALDRTRSMTMRLNDFAPALAQMSLMDFDMSPLAFEFSASPRAPWASGDPADSLYRVARQALNAGEYRRAAQLFASITEKYPRSQYANDASYWRAFALYRIGGIAELHEALRVLDSMKDDTTHGRVAYPGRVQTTRAAQEAMRATQSELLSSAEALSAVQRAVQSAVQRAAQSAAQSATPAAVAAVASLSPAAVTINFDRPEAESALLAMRIRGALAARGDATAAAQIARTADVRATGCDDEDAQLRIEALNALVQMDPKSAQPTVTKVLARRDPCSAQLRRGALSLVARSGDSHSVDVLISTVENDPDLGVRSEAVSLLGRTPDARSTAALSRMANSAGNAALRRIAVRSLAAQGTAAARQSLRDIMSRADAPADVRITALHYAGKSELQIADLDRIYDSASDRSTRYEVVSLLEQRDEPQAADKLADIAKTSTDPALRRMAIDALSRRKDPRTTKLLMDIVDK